MIGKRTVLLSLAASALSLALPFPAHAETYPNRPIRLIVTVASPQDFSDFVAKETPLWTAMVKESGATA